MKKITLKKRHRVVDSWWFAERENKFNPGRRKVRQYIALMGNKELRRKVLGI